MRKLFDKPLRLKAGSIATIYLATNKTNGKKYVGATLRDLWVRIREHKFDARNKNKQAFHKAVARDGIAAFSFEVLEQCDRYHMQERERHWISVHGSREPHGYNVTLGGLGTLGIKRPDVTARLQAMTGANNHAYGTKHTEEENERNRHANLGERNARYGVKLDDDLKRRISEGVKRAYQIKRALEQL